MRTDRKVGLPATLLMIWLLTAGSASSAADRTESWKLLYANVEPDRLPPPADGSFVPLQNGPGAYLRIVVVHRGPATDRITDVVLNGISLRQGLPGRSHPRVQQYPHYQQHSIEFHPGGPPQALLDAGRPVWYRILPSQSTDGIDWTEILVRLRHWHRRPLQVQLPTASGQQIDVAVQTTPDVQPHSLMEQTHIGLATLNAARDRLYVYLLVPRASPENPVSVASLKVDGHEVTAASQRLAGYQQTGVIPLVVPLQNAWQKGSFHLVDCRLSTGEQRVCSLRAGNGFAVMMFGANFGGPRPYIEKGFQEFYEHYIDSWISPGGTESWRQISQDWWQAMAGHYRIRLQPNHHHAGQTREEIRQLARSDRQTLAYWLFDEPDVNDWFDGEHHGIAAPLRLGLHAQRLVQLAATLRAADPVHPTTLVVDKTFRPQNYPTYGQLPDVVQADIYYPLAAHAKQAPWDPLTYMYGDTQAARAGFMPKPMNIVVSASPDGGARPPRPGEERIAVYASVAAGAHGICYYWYNANKEAGCQWVADTWAEIAILNRQLQLLAPWIGVGFPVDLSARTPDKLWVKTVAAGTDALLVVMINRQYRSSPAGFTSTPLAQTPVELVLPAGFTVASAVSIEADGPQAIAVTQADQTARFNTGALEVGRLVLLTRRSGLLDRLQRRWNTLQR